MCCTVKFCIKIPVSMDTPESRQKHAVYFRLTPLNALVIVMIDPDAELLGTPIDPDNTHDP